MVGFTMFLLTAGCGEQDGTDDIARNKPTTMVGALEDKQLAAYQNKLLDLAFKTASAIPVKPHIKDRSRAQEKVVSASLKLDQPRQALACIEKIENWRRGACYGDLAFYCARRGLINEAQQYLNLAIQVLDTAEDWRRDQIMVKIASTYTLLGQGQQADQYVTCIAGSELLKVAGVKVMIAGEDVFEGQMKDLDTFLTSSNFDIVENALEVCAHLFTRFYDDAGRRSLVEKKIKTSLGKLPIFKQVELLTELAKYALEHTDQAKALDLINEAQILVDGARWHPEHRIPLISKLVTLRFMAGDQEKALADANAMLALFDLQRDRIINIDRGGTLRPLAEAYQSMGDEATALAIYKRAVEEGVENPNSRPRAEDLSANCLSMALHGAEPDAELWTRIRQIYDGLGDPW